MNRIFTAMIMVAALTLGAATHDEMRMRGFSMRDNRSSSAEKKLTESLASDAAARDSKKELLPVKFLMNGGEEMLWSNGTDAVATRYDTDDHKVGYSYIDMPVDLDERIVMPEMKIRNGKITDVNARSNKITIERYGNYTMLVERDAKGGFLKAFYHMEDLSEEARDLLFMNTLYGKYLNAKGEAVIFGPVMECYGDVDYNRDPGLFAYAIEPRFGNIVIMYGGGRVSRGNPASPTYGEKMPGAGGAGALMGPMEWSVMPCKEGLRATVTADEPFVNHMPAIGKEGETVTLVKEQCPWEGVPGKWAFASVMPLTTTMLAAFDTATLELIKAEIYARHGDRFANAATQKYFNEQPWYKRSGKAVTLTDVERFNVAVIKRAIALRKK